MSQATMISGAAVDGGASAVGDGGSDAGAAAAGSVADGGAVDAGGAIDNGGAAADSGQSQDQPWTNHLPETLRELPALTKYKTLEDFANGHLNMAKLVGKKGLSKPDGTDAAAMEEYWTAVGRPKDPSEYEFKIPMTDDGSEPKFAIDDAMMVDAKQRMHKLGLSKEQFQGVMEAYGEDLLGREQMRMQELQQRDAVSHANLQRDWGTGFDDRLRAINGFTERAGITQAILDAGLGNNEQLIRALDAIVRQGGDRYVEGTQRGGRSINQQIEDLYASAAYKDPGHPDHDKVRSALVSLYERRSGQTD